MPLRPSRHSFATCTTTIHFEQLRSDPTIQSICTDTWTLRGRTWLDFSSTWTTMITFWVPHQWEFSRPFSFFIFGLSDLFFFRLGGHKWTNGIYSWSWNNVGFNYRSPSENWKTTRKLYYLYIRIRQITLIFFFLI